MSEPALAPVQTYWDFSREEWSRLRAATPLTLSEQDLTELRGLNRRVSLADLLPYQFKLRH